MSEVTWKCYHNQASQWMCLFSVRQICSVSWKVIWTMLLIYQNWYHVCFPFSLKAIDHLIGFKSLMWSVIFLLLAQTASNHKKGHPLFVLSHSCSSHSLVWFCLFLINYFLPIHISIVITFVKCSDCSYTNFKKKIILLQYFSLHAYVLYIFVNFHVHYLCLFSM